MVSPVQFNNNSNVYFRGEKEDLINAPGAFEQQAVPETPADEFVSGEQPEVEEKSSVGSKIAKVVGGLLVAAAALFTAYKWKGDTWLNKEAKGTTAKIKNWLMKPGEYMEKGFKKIKKALGFGKDKVKAEEGKAVTEESKAVAEEGKAVTEEGKAATEEGKAATEEGKATTEENKA